MRENKIILYIQEKVSSTQDKDSSIINSPDNNPISLNSNIINSPDKNPISPYEPQIIDIFSPTSPLIIQKVDESSNKCQKQDEQNDQSESYFMNFPGDDENEKSQEYSFFSEPKTPKMIFKFNNDENENFVEKKNEEKNIKKEDKPNTTLKETKETSVVMDEINYIKKEPYITNITCNVNLNCIINLKTILYMVKNVKYNPKNNNFLIMKLEKSNVTANIFSSGKMTCCGAKSKEELYKSLKKFKKIIKKCEFDVHIKKKQIIIRNIVSSCSVNFKIPLSKLCVHLNKISKSGEIAKKPEKYPGLIYKKKIEDSNICYVFFNSGKINITGAKKEEHIHEAFKAIYPELLKVKMP